MNPVDPSAHGGIMLTWAMLGGLSTLAGVLLLALVEYLRRVFATTRDLTALDLKATDAANGIGERATALTTLYDRVQEVAYRNERRIVALEDSQAEQWKRIAEEVIQPLRDVTRTMQELSTTVALQQQTLEGLCEWIQQQGAPPPPKPPRRRPG